MNSINFNVLSILNENEIFQTEVNQIPIIFRVNKEKIDFSEFENLTDYEKSKRTIIIEKVNNLDLYRTSKFKEGFEDFSLLLSSKLSDIKKI
ncbi:hypothetical protein H0I29_00640 [Polaribacter sp. R2A056_3_33]|uniref:hypothetical protein n=1 Tax=unclassified Polaribacter TaxID=196858 RepID=UPI001C4FC382|nr:MULTISPECIES: hypothetical protein [unclassified Polaribacter]QXP62744.1 hypothetical protein H0I27_12825 [Polaribacter sp. HaHaR_3_91]QXP70649.1 hypothetical protein H0I29_00640 [Polaribacter sp. R2A056_3_33]